MPEKSESAKKTGRPLKYKASKELLKKFNEYKKNRSTDLPLTKESFLVFAEFYDLNALKTYVNEFNKSEFSTTIKKIEMEILSSKIDRGYANPSAMSIFDLKVNHKWIEEKVIIVKDESSLFEKITKAKSRMNESDK